MWPDGTLTTRYAFTHSLYQSVLYEQVTATRRQRFHQRIGEREERGYGEQAGEIVAKLAAHFERSRDYRRAVKYYGQAGEKAIGRSAYQEAIKYLITALRLLKILPDTPERLQLRREGQAAKERGEAVMALAREQGLPHWLAQGTIVWGAALAEQDQDVIRNLPLVRRGV